MPANTFALMNGSVYVTAYDLKAMAMDVLRHRILLTYEAEAEEITSEDVVQKILTSIYVP